MLVTPKGNPSEILERVEEIKNQYEVIRAEAEDGGNDPDELQLLDKVRAKLDELLKKAAKINVDVDFQVDIDAGGSIGGEGGGGGSGGSFEAWEARSSEYHGIIAKIVALKDEGHKATETLEGYLHEISDALSEDRYDDALAQLDLLIQTYELVTDGDETGDEETDEETNEQEGDEDTEAKAEWDRIEPQLEELREIVDRLTLEGHGGATSLFNQYSETLEARTEERWADAVSLLKAAMELARKMLDGLDGGDDTTEEDSAKATWEAMAADLEELAGIIAELREDGDDIWESFQSRHDEISEAAKDERWQDAIDLLTNAISLARRYMEQRKEDPEGGIVPLWWLDANALDPDGNFVPGIEMRLSGDAEGVQRTDPDGNARFVIAGGGRFEVAAIQNGSVVDGASVEEEFPMNQQVINVNLKVEKPQPGINPPGGDTPGGEITTIRQIKAIVTDTEGGKLSDAEVAFDGPNGAIMGSDSAGEATFEVNMAGRYTVSAQIDGRRSNREIVETGLPSDTEVAEVHLVIDAATDTVRWSIKAIVKDPEGNKAAGADVRLYGPEGMSMTSDSNGEALFDVTLGGRYMVQAYDGDAESNSEVINEKEPEDGKIVEAELLLQGAPSEPFEAPTESGEPTLRKGDEDPDGWVEYLQKLLNEHLRSAGQPTISVSGAFDSATDQAVRWFQGAMECLVDGIVGNQTWSALREDAVREAVGTDGREAGTHSETGAEARWSVESRRLAIYEESLDAMRFAIASTGTEPIKGFKADVFIDGSRQQITIGDPASSTGGQDMHVILVTRFRERFGDGPFEIEAYLPQELGGDQWANTVEISGREDPEDPEDPEGPEPGGGGGGGGGTPEAPINWTINAFVQDHEGQPLREAGVTFEGPAALSAMTDSAGHCSHGVQGPGRYEIRAMFGGEMSTLQIVEETAPTDGLQKEVVLIIDLSGHDLQPELLNDWRIDAVVKDQDGNPVPNAAVEFDGGAGFVGMTDAAGGVSHFLQGPGSYRVSAQTEDAESQTEVVEETAPAEGTVREVELIIDRGSAGDDDTTDEEEGNPLLAGVELEIGNDIYGSITVGWDMDGKFKGVELKRVLAEKGLKGGADGVIGGGKVEVSASLEGSMKGNTLTIKSVLAASGSVMVGLGVASPQSWLGIGVEFGLKFARTIETLEVRFDRSVLENAAALVKSGAQQPPLHAAFNLPAKFELSGKFAYIVGGGSGSILEGKLSKTIKEYNPMIVIEITGGSNSITISVDDCPGIYEFLGDIAELTKPPVLRMVEELLEVSKDPHQYVEDRRQEAEKLMDRVTGLPKDVQDFFSNEIQDIRKLL